MLRNVRWSYGIPLLLAFCFAVGTYSGGNKGELAIESPLFMVYFVLYGVLFCVIFRFARRLLLRYASRWSDGAETTDDKARTWFPTDLKPRTVAVQSGVMFLCWLPYLIGYFPGLYWYDTSWQLYQYFQSPQAITDHHPFMDTYLFGWFAEIGNNLWNNPMYGLFILIVIQQILAVTALTCAAGHLARFRIPWGIRIAVYAFFCLFPFFPTIFSSLSKDSVAAPFFIVFCLLVCESIRVKGAVTRPCVFYTLLIVMSLLACLTKKTGMYIIVPALLVMLLLRQKAKSRIALAAVAILLSAIMVVAIPKAVLPALHVQPGESSEMLAVPLQQLAHVAKNDPSGFSHDELAVMSRTYHMPMDKLGKAYSYMAADPVKGSGPARTDRSAFVRMWTQQGLKHPSDYFGAWGGLVAGWFSFDALSNSDWTLLRAFPNSSHHMEQLDALIHWDSDTLAGEQLYRMYREVLLGMPVVSALFYKSLWASVIPFFLVFIVLRMKRSRRKGQALVMLMPIAMTVLSLWAGPTSLYNEAVRYVLPLVCVLPVMGVIQIRMAAVNDGRTAQTHDGQAKETDDQKNA